MSLLGDYLHSHTFDRPPNPVDIVVSDFQGIQWPLSAYAYDRNQPNLIQGDRSPEELRLEAYHCFQSHGNLNEYLARLAPRVHAAQRQKVELIEQIRRVGIDTVLSLSQANLSRPGESRSSDHAPLPLQSPAAVKPASIWGASAGFGHPTDALAAKSFPSHVVGVPARQLNTLVNAAAAAMATESIEQQAARFQLSVPQLEEFLRSEFEFGKIPETAPPFELCG